MVECRTCLKISNPYIAQANEDCNFSLYSGTEHLRFIAVQLSLKRAEVQRPATSLYEETAAAAHSMPLQ